MATISGTSAIKNNAQLTCTYSLTVTPGTQSIEGNYTPINYSYYVLYDTASVQFVGTTRPNAGTVNVVINGTTVASKVVPLTNGIKDGTYIIATTSGTVNVPHNADGTKTLSYSISIASGTDQNNYNYVWNASSKSGSMALTTIPRTSSISLSGHDYLGNAVGVTITRNSTSFTHTVEYSFGSSGWKTAATGVATYHEFTAATTLGWASYIPSSSSGVLTVRVTTYSGSTAIGSVTATKTLNISSQQSAHQPTFGTITATPVSDTVPSSWGLYVSGHSKVKITISGCSGVYGSSIKSYSIYGSGLNVSASSGTSSILTTNKSAGSDLSYVGTVIDSRNQQSSKSTTIHVVPYTPPSVSVTAVRCASDGTESANGTSLKVTATFSCASVSGKNSITSKSITCNSKSNTTFTSGTSFVLAANCSIGSTYTLTATVTDALGETATANITIPTATRVLNVKANKKGIAFGKFSETDETVESAWPIRVGNAINYTDIKKGAMDLVAATPYIDFHYANSTSDYTHRIIADNEENLTITSGLSVTGKITASSATINGPLGLLGYFDMRDNFMYMNGVGTNVSSAKCGLVFRDSSSSVKCALTPGPTGIWAGATAGSAVVGFDVSNKAVRPSSASDTTYCGLSGTPFTYGYFKNLSIQSNGILTIPSGSTIKVDSRNAINAYSERYVVWTLTDNTARLLEIYYTKNSSGTYYLYTTNNSGNSYGITIWASDKSLKDNVKDTEINHALDKIYQIKHVEFDWKDSDGHVDLGYVADDMENILPSLVFKVEQKDKDGNITGSVRHIDHTKLIPLITMGMQELIDEIEFLWEFDNAVVDEVFVLQEKIEEQQTEIDTLKSELSELKTLVNQLLGKENQNG